MATNFHHLQKNCFCYISAKTGYGIDSLKKIIFEKLFENHKFFQVELSNTQGEIRSLIYEKCNVVDDVFTKSGHNMIKFMANQSFVKYLYKKELK